MERITDFRVGELRIPASAFPLPSRVEEKLRMYCGLGKWEGNFAVFEVPVYRLQDLEEEMARGIAGVKEGE